MAAAARVCFRLRKIANPCSSLQAFTLRASCVTVKTFLSSSRVFYSASDEIESNPFYEKYAARIKEVRNEIKEGKIVSANLQHSCNEAILVFLNILIKLNDLLMQVSYSSQNMYTK